MKKAPLILFISFIIHSILFICVCFSQNTITDNYPLKIGNVFVYRVTQFYQGNYSSHYENREVVKDTVINSKRYYVFFNHYSNSYPINRIDTNTGNLFIYGTSCTGHFQESIVDSIWLKMGVSSILCGQLGTYTCSDTNNIDIFNLTNLHGKTLRLTHYSGPLYSQREAQYSEIFGMIYYHLYFSAPSGNSDYWEALTGCIINGVLYGDTTTITGIRKVSENVPYSYSLFQNYPNPFNPTTKIKFDIPAVGNGRDRSVKLTIYDILGREVATLVNEALKPGTYEAEWPAPSGDASSFASGLYFYKLQAGDYIETKKMVLIK